MVGGMVEKLKAVFAAFALLLGLTLSSCKSRSGEEGKDKGKSKVDVPMAPATASTPPTPDPNSTTTPSVPAQTPKQIAEAEAEANIRIAINDLIDVAKKVNERAVARGKHDTDAAEAVQHEYKPDNFKYGQDRLVRVKKAVNAWIKAVKTWTETHSITLVKAAESVLANTMSRNEWTTANNNITDKDMNDAWFNENKNYYDVVAVINSWSVDNSVYYGVDHRQVCMGPYAPIGGINNIDAANEAGVEFDKTKAALDTTKTNLDNAVHRLIEVRAGE
jgi:hypothetical protein